MAKRVRKSQGLGDTVEKITTATGIKKVVHKFSEITGVDCNCDKRKETLNRIFPYQKPNCLIEEDYNYLTAFFAKNVNQLSVNDQYKLIDIYERVFNQRLENSNCSSCWRDRINELQKVYNEYVLNA